MNRPETAIGNGSRWLDGLGGLDEPSLGLSPVLVTEIFRCPMSALGVCTENLDSNVLVMKSAEDRV